MVDAVAKMDPPRLLVGRAERLPFPDATFDALTFTYLMRYVADPAATLKELARVVRPGGCVASLEFAVPSHPPPRPGRAATRPTHVGRYRRWQIPGRRVWRVRCVRAL